MTILSLFKQFHLSFERLPNSKIFILRSDGGGEYKGVLDNYLENNGILHERTNPDSSQQNGFAERFGLTILDRIGSVC